MQSRYKDHYDAKYNHAYQEGFGIWDSFKKFLRKHKVLSRGAKVGALLAGAVGKPAVASGLALGAKYLEQNGYGVGSMSKKPITRSQVLAIMAGLGNLLSNGGVSLQRAKKMYPNIRNILPTQMRALSKGMGRMMKGGGVSLAGGNASDMWKGNLERSMQVCPMARKPVVGIPMPNSGGGVVLPGQLKGGVYVPSRSKGLVSLLPPPKHKPRHRRAGLPKRKGKKKL